MFRGPLWILVALQCATLGLKMTGRLNWSWVEVFLPFLMPVTFLSVTLALLALCWVLYLPCKAIARRIPMGEVPSET